MKDVRRQAPAPEGFGNDVIGVPIDSPIDLELRFEAVVEGVLVTGVAGVELRGECARCLTEVSSHEEIDLQELFLFPGKEPEDAEASRLVDDLVDLEPLLRDAVVLDLPFIPLCRPDCLGLCPLCGVNLNDDPDHTHGEATDPRWAGLTSWDDDTDS